MYSLSFSFFYLSGIPCSFSLLPFACPLAASPRFHVLPCCSMLPQQVVLIISATPALLRRILVVYSYYNISVIRFRSLLLSLNFYP